MKFQQLITNSNPFLVRVIPQGVLAASAELVKVMLGVSSHSIDMIQATTIAGQVVLVLGVDCVHFAFRAGLG